MNDRSEFLTAVNRLIKFAVLYDVMLHSFISRYQITRRHVLEYCDLHKSESELTCRIGCSGFLTPKQEQLFDYLQMRSLTRSAWSYLREGEEITWPSESAFVYYISINWLTKLIDSVKVEQEASGCVILSRPQHFPSFPVTFCHRFWVQAKYFSQFVYSFMCSLNNAKTNSKGNRKRG
jgi:hypothetical protein